MLVTTSKYTDISDTPSLIFTGGGQKVQFLTLSLNESQIGAAFVPKRSEIFAPFFNLVCTDDRQCLHKFGGRSVHAHFKTLMPFLGYPQKTDVKALLDR